MSAPPPKPPKPPPKPPKPKRSAAEEEELRVKSNETVDTSSREEPTSSPPPPPGSASLPRNSSIKIDEALKESVQNISKAVFSGRDIQKAHLYEESFKYNQDTPENTSIATERLQVLNDLFELSASDESIQKDKDKSNSKTPLTGNLIREGFIVKKSRKSDDKVYAILTTEYFAYGKEEFHITGSSTMEIRRILPLAKTLVADCTVQEVSSPPPVSTENLSEEEILQGKGLEKTEDPVDVDMELFVLAKDKSFAVRFNSKEERQQWFTDMIAACSDAQERADKIYSREEMAPVWKQDKTTSHCELCVKKFNLFFRKHHCRNCGKCVCDNCLVEKIRIPALDPRALFRVCTYCSAKLKDERKYMR